MLSSFRRHHVAIALWATLGAVPVLSAPAPLPGPADPDVAVAAPVHESVIQPLRSGIEAGPTGWVRANETVGQFPRGHADLLRWEAAQDAPAAGQVAPTRRAGPAATPPGASR